MAQARKKTETESGFEIQILRHLHHGLRESGFLLLVVLALYLFISLASFDPSDPGWTHTSASPAVHNLGGVVGAWFADVVLYFFGYLAYLIPLAIAMAGYLLFRRRGLGELDAEIVLFRALGFLVTLAAGCGLASLHLRTPPGYLAGSAGGILGDITGQGLVEAFSHVGGSLFLLALFLAGVTLASGLSWLAVVDVVGKLTLDLVRVLRRCVLALAALLPTRSGPDDGAGADHRAPQTPAADPGGEGAVTPLPGSRRVEPTLLEVPPAPPAPDTAPPAPEIVPEPGPFSVVTEASADAPASPPPPPREAPAGGTVAVTRTAPPAPVPPPPAPPGETMERLPPVSLLDAARISGRGYTAEVLEEMSRQVETRLRDFGIEVQVVDVQPGPVITRFELEPAPGVKVSQITNLAKDLARGLSVISVRVVEVIPGKSVIGLEIPNQNREVVYLSEVLHSPVYNRSSSPVTLALGKDISGRPVVANLAKMPHLLVAGTTGAGKSVAINAMLLSMLYKAGPEDVRLILVDPKMLELSVYEGIPHLLAPVVTDMKDAANALRWCVAEMERRYRLMAALKVRNITGFNKVVSDAIRGGQPLADPLYRPEDHLGESGAPPTLETLPFIVVVIDELADMMMIVGKKVEELIARLAQKARAAGIHLILATQRPSVDVITGLIKANIPTRIAFQVSSKTDSRTILDQMGAEQLLGHGDMLYLPPGTGLPQRVHGAFVDDHEVNQVVEYLRQIGEPDYIDTLLEEPVDPGAVLPGEAAASEGEADPLYDQAVRIVTESRRASISGVQRRLKIGYNRAARLVEEMEVAGVVGPLQANGAREVLAPPPPET